MHDVVVVLTLVAVGASNERKAESLNVTAPRSSRRNGEGHGVLKVVFTRSGVNGLANEIHRFAVRAEVGKPQGALVGHLRFVSSVRSTANNGSIEHRHGGGRGLRNSYGDVAARIPARAAIRVGTQVRVRAGRSSHQQRQQRSYTQHEVDDST